MNFREFKRSGHWPSLFSAFLYFDTSFMVWVLLGALGNSLATAFHLNHSQKGLMVAVPILGGAGLRLVLGLLTDRIGARRTGLIGLALTTIPLLLGWLWVDSFNQLLLVGLLLGVAGASFAVALPLASRWYPAEQQGLVMGIAGAGNSGTALATFFCPMLVPIVGWRGVFGLALIPIALVFIAFAVLAKDAPSQPAPKRLGDYLNVLRIRDMYWFSGFYAVTFGGFVGLGSFLPIFFKDQYGIDPIRAGMFAAFCGLAGSLLRPLGGYLSDRLGGIRMLLMFYLSLGVLGFVLATLPRLEATTFTLFLTMAMLGMGNGAIFQLVPQRFKEEIGMVTGLVGAAGGLGGFCLPLILGGLRQTTGSFGPGFFVVGLIGVVASGLLTLAGRDWQRRFLTPEGLALNTAKLHDPEPAMVGFPDRNWEPSRP